ncbi:putative sulfatase [Haloferula luteola]|uniref:Putative sulfatase n=1 Tax=Haloferula luteola TaxID=595692 RepID=A0A840VBM5_9BACT|nr:sulfatase-like hydrolase/transferase [Haloferula luteola]MBB5351209.1 putative sulfatase [Haloferula luteola]
MIRAFALLLLLVTGLQAAPDKPNILFVFIDDMGWGDFSCFGNAQVETQHIDQLASEGLRFEQFYVNSPICSPSRTAISTGQYPQRWKIHSYLDNRAQNERRGMAQWLDPKAPMLARYLHQAGYATGHFGKWHMGGQRDVADAPLITEYGFDASLTNFEGLGPRVLPICDPHNGKPTHPWDLGSAGLGHGPIEWEDRSKVTTRFAEAALDFIKKAESSDTPFYVNLWPDDVHSPFFPPGNRQGDAKRKLYQRVLDSADEQLAPILDYVRRSEKLRGNTVIVVCSDNGPEPGAGTAGPFKGHKTELYEGGVRSPLIVWSPGFLAADQAGKTNTQSVLAAIDLVPSLLELAGVEAPDAHFDGQARLATFLGKSTESRDKPLFFRRPPDRPGNENQDLPDLAVRDGQWKLLCEYDGSEPQLYNLDSDREETQNLASKKPKIVARLTRELLAWHQAMPADKGSDFERP